MRDMRGEVADTTWDLARLIGYPTLEELLGPSVRPLAQLLDVPARWAPHHWDEWDRLYEQHKAMVLMAAVGSLKSSWMVLLKAKEILRDPASCTMLHASSTGRLASRMVTQLQAILLSSPIVEVFGDLEGELWNMDEFSVRQHDPMIKTPTCVAVGIGSRVEGDRFRHGHMDDPLDLQDAVSEITRENKLLWYQQTFANRINWYDPLSRQLIIGSRWHPSDLYHDIAYTAEEKALGGVTYRSYPAILDDGTMAFPELYTPELLRQIRERIGEAAFSMRYQCSATALQGRMLKVPWLKNFWADAGQVPPWSELDIVQAWDLAFTEQDLVGSVRDPKDQPDYTVCVTLGGHRLPDERLKLWILHIYRTQIAGGHKRHIETLWQKFRPRKVYVETNGYKTIEWELRDSMVPMVPVEQHRRKFERIMDLAPYFERDQFRMQRDLRHADDFFHEYETFPYGKHEDILDAAATGLRGYVHEGEEWFGSLKPPSARI